MRPTARTIPILACACGVSLFVVVPKVHAAAGDANWADRKEYDLVLTIRAETTPQKRLELLDTWRKQYPTTPLQQARFELYLQTYQALAKPAESFRIAREVLKGNPNSEFGLYWCMLLLPEIPSPSPDMLSAGENASQQLLEQMKTSFAADKKPPSMSAAEWQNKATVTEALAHRSLGWASWQRGNLATAESQLSAALGKDPQNGQISAWLGIVLSLENGKQVPAMWQLARALNASTSISDEERREVKRMLEQVYTSYHGSLDGIEDLRKASASNAFPDPAFSIDSASTVEARRVEAELSLTNPELAAWMSIRRQLTAADGQQYFATNLQNKAIPDLKGTVVKSTAAHSGKELLVAMTDESGPEVTIELTSPLRTFFGSGSKIEFHGTAQFFTTDPFNLVLSAGPGDIQPAPKSPTPPR